MMIQTLHHSAAVPALAAALLSLYWLVWTASRRRPAETGDRPRPRQDYQGRRRSS
jgi:hypothetical protein